AMKSRGRCQDCRSGISLAPCASRAGCGSAGVGEVIPSSSHICADPRPGSLGARSECRDPCELAPDDELVHFVGALVGAHRFEVRHMAHDWEVARDAVSAENRPALARDADRLAHIVELADRDLAVSPAALLL